MKLSIRRILVGEAEKLHELLSDEKIRPFALIGHEGTVDLSGFLLDLRNIAILCEDPSGAPQGALLFHWQEPGVYEVHTMAREAARGRPYMAAVSEAIWTIFLCSDCMELYTRVPEGNLAALGLVRWVRGRREFSSLGSEFYALRWSDWLWGTGRSALIGRGKWFHERLEAQFAEQKREHAAHEDSLDHDAMVGATVELILNGIVQKGLILYNRWAKLAGYATCAVVVQNPLVLNIGDALVQVDFAKRDFYLLEAKPEDLRVPFDVPGDEIAQSQMVH